MTLYKHTLMAALLGAAALTMAMPSMADDERWERHDRGWDQQKHYDKHHYKHHHRGYREHYVVREAPVVYERRVVYERPYYTYRRDPVVVIDLPSIVIPLD